MSEQCASCAKVIEERDDALNKLDTANGGVSAAIDLLERTQNARDRYRDALRKIIEVMGDPEPKAPDELVANAYAIARRAVG